MTTAMTAPTATAMTAPTATTTVKTTTTMAQTRLIVLCSAAFFTGCLGQIAAAQQAETYDDPHLPSLVRTPAEIARISAIVTPTTDFSKPENFELNQGGGTSIPRQEEDDIFMHPAQNFQPGQDLDFFLGEAMFQKLWVPSPSSTRASDGLGPFFNARSCLLCHVKNGRGHTPENEKDDRRSLFLRISVPATDDDALTEIEEYLALIDGENATLRTRPDPVYGGQLQDRTLQNMTLEGEMGVAYQDYNMTLSDGTIVPMRRPDYWIDKPGYGALPADQMISPRLANPMIGLGLLDAIPSADILANADPDDLDGDGISGRPNIVWSHIFEQPVVGRFGWKAGKANIVEQSAAAFSGDIGISSPVFPAPAGDCTAAQVACQSVLHGDGDVRTFEVDNVGLDLTVFYTANLAVPSRGDVDDPEVLRGKAMFYQSGCVSCHTPKHVTARLDDEKFTSQSFQLIWPYSDLLLHDMGPELSDNRPEGRATAQEWRTPPLWGIGLTGVVSNNQASYLHDGRARTLLEAILWHGGEGATARDAVVNMQTADREYLIKFLESL